MFNHICFKFLKKIFYDHRSFYEMSYVCWFQVMLVVSWLVSGSFRWFRSFQVVSRFSKYINVFKKTVYRLEGAYPGNSVGRGGKIMSQLLC